MTASWQAAEALARTLLFEGHSLYPYRASAIKNQRRWLFGSLYPPAFCRDPHDRSRAAFGCLVRGEAPRVRASLRFLERTDIEHVVDLELGERAESAELAFVRGGVRGVLSLAATRVDARTVALDVVVRNETPLAAAATDDRDEAHRSSLAAAHVLLGCQGGRIVSRVCPDQDLVEPSQHLTFDGLWPALVGDDGQTAIASPIILQDQPTVAPESAGNLFDSTEMDEMLALRIRTLTPEERDEAAAADPRVRALIERTEALTDDDLARLHGTWRSAFNVGDAVRLRPGKRPGQRGDALDIALAGERATIVRVDRDLEGRAHYAVTIDRDPGRDLGLAGFPGHRFYFAGDELERMS